ncbi:hypothetical protein BJ508DRAFT_88910 [Ascobolus immersus RN42]|uniref:Uncharacterized protein n=1 Tax=Ascobolus immersus RN42 TaxID=1160509 RepID=A0A3N4I8Q5_ASCIM|nr:hypothetical protein BJ508DRAFT_88910 [Ascobolus immersus RN42]
MMHVQWFRSRSRATNSRALKKKQSSNCAANSQQKQNHDRSSIIGPEAAADYESLNVSHNDSAMGTPSSSCLPSTQSSPCSTVESNVPYEPYQRCGSPEPYGTYLHNYGEEFSGRFGVEPDGTPFYNTTSQRYKQPSPSNSASEDHCKIVESIQPGYEVVAFQPSQFVLLRPTAAQIVSARPPTASSEGQPLSPITEAISPVGMDAEDYAISHLPRTSIGSVTESAEHPLELPKVQREDICILENGHQGANVAEGETCQEPQRASEKGKDHLNTTFYDPTHAALDPSDTEQQTSTEISANSSTTEAASLEIDRVAQSPDVAYPSVSMLGRVWMRAQCWLEGVISPLPTSWWPLLPPEEREMGVNRADLEEGGRWLSPSLTSNDARFQFGSACTFQQPPRTPIWQSNRETATYFGGESAGLPCPPPLSAQPHSTLNINEPLGSALQDDEINKASLGLPNRISAGSSRCDSRQSTVVVTPTKISPTADAFKVDSDGISAHASPTPRLYLFLCVDVLQLRMSFSHKRRCILSQIALTGDETDCVLFGKIRAEYHKHSGSFKWKRWLSLHGLAAINVVKV